LVRHHSQLRPELRFERAWDRKAYDNEQHQNQLTVASDLISTFELDAAGYDALFQRGSACQSNEPRQSAPEHVSQLALAKPR